MRISVLIPAHNEQEHVAECIDSVLSQSHRDVEVIVICDSCTDATVEIVRSRGISPIEVSHRSIGLTLNEGLRAMSGDYFFAMGADDYLSSPDSLGILNDRIESTPSLPDVLAFGAYFGERIASCWHAPGEIWPNVSFNMFRTTSFNNCFFDDAPFAEDGRWVARHVKPHHQIEALDIPIYQYRYPRRGSAVDKHHAQLLESLICDSPGILSSSETLFRVPFRLKATDLEAFKFFLDEAHSKYYLWPPTLVAVLDHEPYGAEVDRVLRLAQICSPEPGRRLSVKVESYEKALRTGDIWGILTPRHWEAGDAHLRSMKTLLAIQEINSRAGSKISRNVIKRVSDHGLPPSFSEGMLQVYNEVLRLASSESMP